MVAHVTPDDLHQHLTPYEMANGLMNRFLIVHLTRRQLLPHGGRPVGLSPLVALLHQVLAHSVTLSLIDREPEANYMWEQVYGPLVEPRDGVAGKVIQRRRAHVLRLSATYAAFDGLPKVNTEHLMAALAVWQFSEGSAYSHFGGHVEFPLDRRVLDLLRPRPHGLPKAMIADLLSQTGKRDELTKSLARLEAHGLLWSEPRVGDGGRETEFYFATEPEKRGAFDYLAIAERAAEEIASAGGVPKGHVFHPSLSNGQDPEIEALAAPAGEETRSNWEA